MISKTQLKKLTTALTGLAKPDEIRVLAYVWIDELLSGFAFDADLGNAARGKAAGFYKDHWGSKGKFPKSFRAALVSQFGFTTQNIEKIEQQFCSVLAL